MGILSEYVDYYNRSRTHLSLAEDAPEPRSVQPPSQGRVVEASRVDRKSTRLNSSHEWSSYAVFCLKKKSYADRRRADRHQQPQHKLACNPAQQRAEIR